MSAAVAVTPARPDSATARQAAMSGMPAKVPLAPSAGSRKWPGHHRPQPPSTIAATFSIRPTRALRRRAVADTSEPSQSRPTLSRNPAKQGSSRWLSRKCMKAGLGLFPRRCRAASNTGAPRRSTDPHSFRYRERFLERLRRGALASSPMRTRQRIDGGPARRVGAVSEGRRPLNTARFGGLQGKRAARTNPGGP